ncbi:lipoteichoic acid stability factor AuxB [Staphylococcus durrellii]|uniref:lipoteichoic acid stability factor AuxB n=1 Tax=Staphylococcus durrellii TaxID=2781773 RepID=UPI0018A0B6B5|nr:DUF4064 domain-containing protein [Staphylococcus durrellii]MBF7017407.1 DUF4064 domain-containing protein [Staphylococcus durrellii]
MSGEQFTQVRRPVSRLTEKVLGWLSWIFLLLLTVATMFIALVSFSSDTSIQKLESSLNANEFAQQIFANNNLNTTQAVIWLQNGVWAIIVYLIICLLISFLALISMNIRILSGFLFLIATIVTLPLMVLFVPLIIPVLFIIVAIMMFARKDRVETIPAYYDDDYYDRDAQSRYGYDREPVQRDNKRKSEQESTSQYQSGDETTTMRRQSNDSTSDEQVSTQSDEEETKDYNSLRRGGYSSEVARQVNGNSNAEEEPQVLSRQAKYNYKNKANAEYEVPQNDDSAEEDYQRGPSQEELERQEAERQQQAEEEARRKQEEAEEKMRLKQERAEERSRIKQEKKELRKRMKEKRKQQPSAVNQRRMNYEERKKMTSNDDNAIEKEATDQTSDNQDTTTTDNKEK